MKKFVLLMTVCIALLSCKMILKGAAKHWGKKHVEEWLVKCEEHSSKLMGAERAKTYCNCAVEEVAKKYNSYEEVKKMGIIAALLIAKNCKD